MGSFSVVVVPVSCVCPSTNLIEIHQQNELNPQEKNKKSNKKDVVCINKKENMNFFFKHQSIRYNDRQNLTRI